MIKRKTTDDPRPDTKGPYISILARRCVYLARLYKRQVPRLASAPFYFIHHPPPSSSSKRLKAPSYSFYRADDLSPSSPLQVSSSPSFVSHTHPTAAVGFYNLYQFLFIIPSTLAGIKMVYMRLLFIFPSNLNKAMNQFIKKGEK